MKRFKKFIGYIGVLLVLLSPNLVLADRAGNFWNQPSDSYVVTQNNSAGVHRDIGSNADRLPHGFFTNLDVTNLNVGGGNLDLPFIIGNTASGATASTVNNSAGISLDLPVTGVNATLHSWNFKIDGNSFLNLFATGDGAGSIAGKEARFSVNENHLTGAGGATTANEYFSLTGLAQPYATGGYDSTNYGALELNGGHGGLVITGLTNSSKTAITFQAIAGATTLTDTPLVFNVSKSDGAGGITQLANTESLFQLTSGGGMPIWNIFGNGEMTISDSTISTGTARLNIKSPANITGTGTIDNAAGANGGTVVGNGTFFLTQLAVGDKIVANGAVSTVRTIVDNTHLTVDYPGIWTNQAFTIAKPVERILDSSNNVNITQFPTGGITATNFHSTGAGSLIKIGEGNIPGLGFGFLDPAFNHTIRSAGGANQDVIFDVFGTSAHFFGIDGLFKTGFGATIGDSTFGITAPVNGLRVIGRVEPSKGANVAAANNLTLGDDGNVFHITGATQINCLTNTNWGNGTIILIFDSNPVVKHNQACGAGTLPFLLTGSGDYATAANSVLQVVVDSTFIREVSRTSP